jgi:hypothetical protein
VLPHAVGGCLGELRLLPLLAVVLVQHRRQRTLQPDTGARRARGCAPSEIARLRMPRRGCSQDDSGCMVLRRQQWTQLTLRLSWPELEPVLALLLRRSSSAGEPRPMLLPAGGRPEWCPVSCELAPVLKPSCCQWPCCGFAGGSSCGA